MCSDEGRDDCQQLKPKGSHVSFVTTVMVVTILMLSILFSRVTVNVLVFVLRVVFFVARGTCAMLGVGILRYQEVLFQN